MRCLGFSKVISIFLYFSTCGALIGHARFRRSLPVVPGREYAAAASITQHRRPRMSLLNFLENRGSDFIRLEDAVKSFGPGPLLVIYNCPPGIDNEEIGDMIQDVAPIAHKSACRIHRIHSNSQLELDMPMGKVLERIVGGELSCPEESAGETSTTSQTEDSVVLLFSGFRQPEMMAVYEVLGQEIFDETCGRSSPACAMAVPNAMNKPLRQVLEEISGDHKNAIGSSE